MDVLHRRWDPVEVDDWFLPAAERPWTSGNLVVPRVHGADYFARLLDVIGSTRSGDRIFLTDWRGDADERMTEDGPTVGELLSAARSSGVSTSVTVGVTTQPTRAIPKPLRWTSGTARRRRGTTRWRRFADLR